MSTYRLLCMSRLVVRTTKKPRVHRIKGQEVIKRYRLIPYGDLADVLKGDGEAFVEGPLKRGTAWKAARRLSEMVGKKVIAEWAVLKLADEDEALEGYSFSVESKGSPQSGNQRGTS